MLGRRLFRDFRFVVLFLAGAAGTFPLFVLPFFLPLYGHSLHLSSSTNAGLVAVFNFSSTIGRLCCGLLSDSVGPLNTLFLSLFLSALSMLVLWPVSNTLAPLIVFAIINGMANGGFFSTMPTVVGSVFGSARLSVAMGMVITGWGGGYLLVRCSTSSVISEGYLEELGLLTFRRVLQLQDICSMHTEEKTALFKLIILLCSTLDLWH